jgi:hypothetical protein
MDIQDWNTRARRSLALSHDVLSEAYQSRHLQPPYRRLAAFSAPGRSRSSKADTQGPCCGYRHRRSGSPAGLRRDGRGHCLPLPLHRGLPGVWLPHVRLASCGRPSLARRLIGASRTSVNFRRFRRVHRGGPTIDGALASRTASGGQDEGELSILGDRACASFPMDREIGSWRDHLVDRRGRRPLGRTGVQMLAPAWQHRRSPPSCRQPA